MTNASSIATKLFNAGATAAMTVGELLAVIDQKWATIFDETAAEQSRRREAGEDCPPILTMVAERHPEVLPLKEAVLDWQACRRILALYEPGVKTTKIKIWPDSTAGQKLEAAMNADFWKCGRFDYLHTAIQKAVTGEGSVEAAQAAFDEYPAQAEHEYEFWCKITGRDY